MSSPRNASASELIVEWTAPPECPDQDDVVSDVERALGEGAKPNLTAIARVTRAADTFRAQVRITSSAGFGDRDLEAVSCEILAESVALVIALSASRSADSRGEVKHREHDRGLEVALSPHASAAIGPLPEPAFGAGATIAIEGFAALRLELSGTYHARQSHTFDETNVGGRFDLLRLGARGCRLWTLGAFELGPCFGAQLYRIEARGFGGMLSYSGESLMWGPAAGAFGRLRLLDRFAVHLTADAVVPVSRQRFVFSDVGPLHRPSILALQLVIAPEVLF